MLWSINKWNYQLHVFCRQTSTVKIYLINCSDWQSPQSTIKCLFTNFLYSHLSSYVLFAGWNCLDLNGVQKTVYRWALLYISVNWLLPSDRLYCAHIFSQAIVKHVHWLHFKPIKCNLTHCCLNAFVDCKGSLVTG